MVRNLLLAGLLTFFTGELFGQTTNSLALASQDQQSEMGFVVVEELDFSSAPNPFSRETTIQVQLPETGKVSLKVFDILGQEVASIVNGVMSSGNHKLTYFGSELPAGRYYFHLNAGGKVIIRQVMKRN